MKTNPATDDLSRFLASREYIDSDSPQVRQYTARALHGLTDKSETARAIRLFNTVRDGLHYDPYRFDLDLKKYKASVITQQDASYCIPKAILLTACLRAAKIPAAIGFADVRNHLMTPKLTELMKTDVFLCHGYVQLWLDETPYKVTPAFNTSLCQRFGVKPLVFDGKSDALFHEFDAQGRRHMEYVNDRGVYEDIPAVEILAVIRNAYPGLEEAFEQHANTGASGYDDKFAPPEHDLRSTA